MCKVDYVQLSGHMIDLLIHHGETGDGKGVQRRTFLWGLKECFTGSSHYLLGSLYRNSAESALGSLGLRCNRSHHQREYSKAWPLCSSTDFLFLFEYGWLQNFQVHGRSADPFLKARNAPVLIISAPLVLQAGAANVRRFQVSRTQTLPPLSFSRQKRGYDHSCECWMRHRSWKGQEGFG